VKFVFACPAPVETVAEVGEIPITVPPVSVTMADPVAVLSVLLDAVTVMVGGRGHRAWSGVQAARRNCADACVSTSNAVRKPGHAFVRRACDDCLELLRLVQGNAYLCRLQDYGDRGRTRRLDSCTTGYRDGSDAKDRKQEQIRRTIRSVKRGGSPTQSRFHPPLFD
jgi:hypothetical protein